MSARKTYVIGVGMTSFDKPRGKREYDELGREAAVKALLDAGINYDEVEQVYAGYAYGDSTCGQKCVYGLGMTGVPIINVNNNCSTGSTALFLARQAVASGISECTMAVGFEKMSPGSLKANFTDRIAPMDITHKLTRDVIGGTSTGPMAAVIFGNGAKEYEKYGSNIKHVAAIAAKNHEHSSRNAYSQFQNVMTTEQVLADKKVTNYLTRGMCCPTSDGGACSIVASEEFVHAHGLENQAIEIVAQTLTTDSPALFDKMSAIELTGLDMTRMGAQKIYKQAGITPDDIQVIELHDCFAANELLLYDGLGLTPPGKAHELVDRGDFTYGGKWVINPSGGLESKGHPLGATGLGMIFYLVNQLRGWAGPMQVPSCVPGVLEKEGKTSYALQHNLGLGGACVMSVLRRPEFFKAGVKPDGRDRVGYEFGYEARRTTQEDLDKVKSRRAFSQYALI